MTKDGATVHNIIYHYDDLNRLYKVYQGSNHRATYEYDANGNRTKLTYATGTVTTYTYNLANWVTSLTSVDDDTTLVDYQYTYFASGNQKQEKNLVNGTTTTYTYDRLGRLTKEAETNGLTVSYSYDAAGNRTKMAVSGTETYTTTYTYDANNRLTQENKKVGSTTTTTVYSYDDNGNLLQKSNPNAAEQYDYNGFNQLVAVKQPTGAVAYAYNAQGIRTAKRTADTDTYFLLDGGNVVAEYANDELVGHYVWGINPIRRKFGDSVRYFLFNAHGDVVGITNGDGKLINRYDYDAFGNEEKPSSSDTNPFRYCSEYFDKETKTYYLRARYYDPAIGRFTQQDTHWSPANAIYGDNPRKIYEGQDALGLSTYAYAPEISAIMQSGNLYVYCVNNPVAYCDLTGNVLTLANIIGAVIGAGGGALLGTLVADYYGLEGWRRTATIAGFTVGGTALGWFAGPLVEKLALAIATKLGVLAPSAPVVAQQISEKVEPIIGSKLDYVFGQATGSPHNIERSLSMLNQLEQVGILNNSVGREYVLGKIIESFYNCSGIIQENGRVLREILLMGPHGGLKMQTIWEGVKLITVKLFS